MHPSHKQAMAPWLGAIPAHWKERRVKTAVRRSTVANHPNEVVLSLYRDLGVVIKSDREDNFNRTSDDTSNYKYVETGDLVVNKMKAWQGSVAVSSYTGIVSPAYQVYKLVDDSVYGKYLHYLLRDQSYLPEYRRLSGGIRIGQWDLSAENFMNINILVPPIDEQKAIASFLDRKTSEIDEAVSEIERSVELLQEYRQSVISEAVTRGLDPNVPMKDSGVEWIGRIPTDWKITKIKYLAKCLNGDRGVNYPSGADMVDEGIAFVTTDAIHNYEVDFSKVKRITEERYSLLGGVKLKLDDIVYCLRGSVGSCAINSQEQSGTVASSLMAVRPLSANAPWLTYMLQSSITKIQVSTLMNGTCAANLSAENVANFTIPMPPPTTQLQIADYLHKITGDFDSLIADKQRQVELLKEYRRSLISEAVTGKLKVPGLE